MTTLREQMLAAGMQPDQLDNHYSDLYVLKNPISTKVLESYEFKANVTTFVSEAEPYKGELWYDIPFAYMPEHQSYKQLRSIQSFYRKHSEFLGNREESIIFGSKSYIDLEESEDYPGCYVVVNPEISGDNSCVVSWEQQGVPKGTIRG